MMADAPRPGASAPADSRDFTIRVAVSADADRLALLVKGLNADQGDPIDFFGEQKARELLVASDTFAVFLAEADGEAQGYALVTDAYETGYAVSGCYLADLFVVPEARRLGIGRALVARCAAEVKARRGGFLWWTSHVWNEDAHAFYTRLGATGEPVMAHALFGDPFETLAGEDPID